MDGNINKKVYINPNFKRTPIINTWPFVHPNTSNIYKDYSQQVQNEKLMENHLIRKIYVNPNFKQVNQTELYSNAPERHEKDENINVYPKLISNSKYALVANKIKEDVRSNSRQNQTCININTAYKTDNLYIAKDCTQNVLNNKYQMGVPIIKSRYTLVRKNVVSDDKKEIIAKSPEIPIGSSSLKTCYSKINTALFKNQENNKCKPSEKIIKIKISKYKTVPITYINHPLDKVKECKLNPPMSQSYTNTAKFNKHEVSYKNNRYKLTRSTSKYVGNIGNPAKTNTRTINKNVWHNQSKIKLLKANFKINNIPCRLFTKYGKCLRKDYGKCEYLHDKKHVSLCRKFLKGICHDINCALSHELTANKMPTCFFYLKGICTKENCPYLHIKLNDKTKVCPNFLRGYCEKGDMCKFKHIKVNHCKKIKTLINNSVNKLQNQQIKLKKGKTVSKNVQNKNVMQSNEKTNITSPNEEQSNIECRYYKEMVTNEDSCKNIKPTRCKIGTLPSFIQL